MVRLGVFILHFVSVSICECYTAFAPPLHKRFPVSSLGARSSQAHLTMTMSAEKKLLVLGGTGFVGGEILRLAVQRGYKVVSVSRRGLPPNLGSQGNMVDWREGNAADLGTVDAILGEGGFTGVVHAIGMLFESDINRFASGSGSIPTAGSTYDLITRQTAINAIGALSKTAGEGEAPFFAFVSAAEAAWTFDQRFEGTPAEWLRRYLVAKRAVEDTLLSSNVQTRLRPIIVRPSLVWTWSKPGYVNFSLAPPRFRAARRRACSLCFHCGARLSCARRTRSPLRLMHPVCRALLPVAAFTVGNKIGLPFVDKPVNVELLARSVSFVA